jgi:hypothetical protein
MGAGTGHTPIHAHPAASPSITRISASTHGARLLDRLAVALAEPNTAKQQRGAPQPTRSPALQRPTQKWPRFSRPRHWSARAREVNPRPRTAGLRGGGSLAEGGLEHGDRLLDRVEVRGAGREAEQPRADRLDHPADAAGLVSRQAVNDDDVPARAPAALFPHAKKKNQKLTMNNPRARSG